MLNNYKRIYKATGTFNGSEINRVEVGIEYKKGDVNFFDGAMLPRGYYFSMSAYKLNDHGSYTTREFTVGAGGSRSIHNVIECGRQSAKQYELAKGMVDECMDEMLPSFCAYHGIQSIDLGSYEVEERQARVY